MMSYRTLLSVSVTSASLWLIFCASSAQAQKKKGSALKAPEPGYVFPSGGQPGSTINVTLGGFDWTPDVDLIALDPRVKLEYSGELGPVIVPPPPYWFGPKGTIAPLPLPRERSAKITLPAGLSPGPVRWITASASGVGANTGTFWIGDGRPEVIESTTTSEPRTLPALPITVNGRLSRIEEVDRYRFIATKSGPVTLEMVARRLGSDCNICVKVRDTSGKRIVDRIDSAGQDLAVTFAAIANTEYTIELHDLDFRGDQSFVYRLDLTPGPRVVATIPPTGKRGITQPIEFVGYGVATGEAKLESVTKSVSFPADSKADSLHYRLETAFGTAPTIRIPVADTVDTIATSDMAVSLPSSVVGVLDRTDEARFTFTGVKGQVIQLTAEARRFGSPLDVALSVLDEAGQEIGRNDDLPNTTDAGLVQTLPADGSYTVVVSDVSGNTGSRAAVYRLHMEPANELFELTALPRVNVELGGSGNLLVTAVRAPGFTGAIPLRVEGLPPGITVAENLEIPAKRPNVKIPFTATADLATTTWPIQVVGTTIVGDQEVVVTATAPLGGDLTNPDPESNQTTTLLLATTMPPQINLVCVEADGGRKVHRGTTHPAEVTIDRVEGFDGPVHLQMSAKQSYQRQGITGPDMTVEPGIGRAFYPCFMPEWLETTRTSRMELIGVVKVKDPKGRERYLATPMAGRITMSIEGAILKVESPLRDFAVEPGEATSVPVTVLRAAKLAVPVRLELVLPPALEGVFAAESVVVEPGKTTADIRIRGLKPIPSGRHELQIRGTAMQDGKYAVVSEATLTVFGPDRTPATAVGTR